MEEEQTQFEIPTDGDVDLEDDDIASAMGFATTLSEPLIPMDEETMMEGEVEEAPQEETEPMEEEPEMEEPEGEVSSGNSEHDAVMEAMTEEIRALWQEIGRLKGEGTKE